MLAAHPQWQERARTDETARTWLINETLRLYPPTWLISRMVAQDGIYAGWRLRAGDELVLSPYVSHRDAQVFPDPEEFRPERWNGLHPRINEYFPFGAGARRCVGAELSLARLDHLVREVLQAGTVEGPAPTGMSTTITLVPQNLRLRFRSTKGGLPGQGDQFRPGPGPGLA
ncbi:cytochrome P450 [Kineosporia babensis]|uniref:Cytochrome P450 n=2 Tax=Kineosporia babensis TaxID=499548 RepID=A0A9X1NHK7_9ACTN|nr:cytochrome P450 [Kineosporia babensis]